MPISSAGIASSRRAAEIVFGARANAAFSHRAVHDGEILRVGGVELQAIETPGHTPESVSWLVSEKGRPLKLMTGDSCSSATSDVPTWPAS